MDIRPAIQAMPLYDIEELIILLLAGSSPADESDTLFLKELLEQWRLDRGPLRE
jgi:hypothetical protein